MMATTAAIPSIMGTMTDDPSWEGETRQVDARLLRDHLGDDLGA